MSTTGTKPILPWAAAIYTPLKPLAWPVIRFSTGLFLVPHGAQKLFGWFGGGLNATTQGFAHYKRKTRPRGAPRAPDRD